MLRLARYLIRPLRRHPWITAGTLLLLLGAAFGGVNLWALHHFRAAERDLHAGRFDDAGRHIESCLRVWWRSPAVLRTAARVERLRARYPEAEAYLLKCQHLEGEPTDPTQLEWLLLRAQRGELVEVEAELWYLVTQKHPETPTILEALARGYLAEMRLHMAVGTLSLWLAEAPDTPRALGWRGWAYARAQSAQKATRDYQRLLELEPDNAAAHQDLAELLIGKELPGEAMPHVDWLRQHDPDDVNVQVLQARCYFLQGKTPEAWHLLDGVLAAHPDHVGALLQRGKMELETGQPAAAETWLRRALKADPYSAEGRYSLYKSVQQQGGREEEAAKLLKNSEQLKRDKTQAASLLFKGRLEMAAMSADRAAQAGELFLRIGHENVGLQWLGIALKRDPNHRRTHRILARHFESKGQPEKAVRHRRIAGPEPTPSSSHP